MEKFPDWAPKNLIDVYRRMETSAKELEELHAQIDAEDGGIDQAEKQKRALRAEQDKQDRTLLYRFLTHSDMKSVWETLCRQKTSEKISIISANFSFSENLWAEIYHFIIPEYRKIPKITAAEKKKKLENISKTASKLIGLIDADPYAEQIADQVILSYIGDRHIDYRIDGLEESIDWIDSSDPLHQFSCDSDSALKLTRNLPILSGEECKVTGWSSLPESVKFAYWTRELGNLNLIDVLKFFVGNIESNANIAPNIKQPNRGDDAFKPFLIRKLSDWMMWRYEKYLDETVAKIITAALDLETPLSRDDVKTYRDNNKKI